MMFTFLKKSIQQQIHINTAIILKFSEKVNKKQGPPIGKPLQYY